MKSTPAPSRIAHLTLSFLLGAVLVYFTTRPEASSPPKATTPTADDTLVRSLLSENLSHRTFSFSTIASTCSGKPVIPLAPQDPAHQRVTAAIEHALTATLAELNLPTSPIRTLRRINEASRFFEDGIQKHINAMPGFTCEIPITRSGDHQRSGYPDLKITDQQSRTIFYLDPKLIEQGSAASTFRTFYFEPKNETLKINDAAVHLLVGIEHDGKDQAWTFTGWRLVDLSTLNVRLKAEFQASNRDMYRKSTLTPAPTKP